MKKHVSKIALFLRQGTIVHVNLTLSLQKLVTVPTNYIHANLNDQNDPLFQSD